MAKGKKSTKPKSKNPKGSKKIAKKFVETKLLKSIVNAPVDLTHENIYHTPYFRDGVTAYHLSYNFSITQGGTTTTDGYVKDFIQNGTGFQQRIGRSIHLLGCREKQIFELKPVGGATGTDAFPSLIEIRHIQGWVKGGLNNFMELTTEVNDIYDEINWTKYKVLKDRIYTRRALSYNTQLGTTPATASSYDAIKINNVWRPNKVLKWDKDTVTAAGSRPCEYSGWVPFQLILNPYHAKIKLVLIHNKRTLSYRDV